VWSVMVVSCGMVTGFTQLLLIRIGVAVGEAGCIPPAHSLIADYFTRAERPRAVALYMLGGSFSVVIGYFGAGWINEFYGWRMTFVILGAPGLVLAVLVRLTLKEPRNTARTALRSARQPRFGEAFLSLSRGTAARHLLLCFSVLSYGLGTGTLGTWFAVTTGFGGILGTYIGGELASRFATHNESLQLKAMAVAFCFFSLTYAAVYLVRNDHLAFALLGLATLGGAATMAPLFATIQGLVPQNRRAVSIAIVYLCGNLIGLGLGPLAVGALSDGLRPWVGEESLRYALVAMCPGFLWGAWHAWRASESVAQDLEAIQGDGATVG
jgi:MFS family permease